MPRNAYEYDDEDDGMRAALDRARGGSDDDAEPQPMVLPEMDFTQHTDADPELAGLETQPTGEVKPKETDAMHAQRKAAEFDEEGDYSPHNFTKPPMVPAGPTVPKDDDYSTALAKLQAVLH